MVVALFVFFTIFLMFEAAHASKNPCASTKWWYYKAENTCIIWTRTLQTWYQASNDCGYLGAGLVLVTTKAKENFLHNNLFGRDVYYWIGASDLDGDGTYHYMNGSVVASDQLGVRQWSNQPLPSGQWCCALNHERVGWFFKKCTLSLNFICEQRRDPQITPDQQLPCSEVHCTCNKEDWIPFPTRNKYIKPNRVREDYPTSVKICERLGGQLLTLPNEARQKFVEEKSIDWPYYGVLYWIGLRADKEDNWSWADDATSYTPSYENWLSGPLDGLNCAGAVFQYSSKWRRLNCTGSRFQICEAREPCTAWPVLVVDNTTIKRNEYVSKTDRSNPVHIQCFAKGYDILRVKFVTFWCKGKTREMTRKLEVTTTLDLGPNWQNTRCYCRLVMDDNSTKQESFKINFRTAPVLASKSLMPLFEAKLERELVARIDILANPKPQNVSITIHGTDIFPLGFECFMTPTSKPIHYALTLRTDNFRKKHIGQYDLTVRNSMPGMLSFTFALREARSLFEGHFLWMILLFITNCLTMGLLIWVASARHKNRDEGNEEENSSDDVPTESRAEDSDANFEFETITVDTASSKNTFGQASSSQEVDVDDDDDDDDGDDDDDDDDEAKRDHLMRTSYAFMRRTTI